MMRKVQKFMYKTKNWGRVIMRNVRHSDKMQDGEFGEASITAAKEDIQKLLN